MTHDVGELLRRLKSEDTVWKKLCMLSASQKQIVRDNLVGCILGSVTINGRESQPLGFSSSLGEPGLAVNICSYFGLDAKRQLGLPRMLELSWSAMYRPTLFSHIAGACNESAKDRRDDSCDLEPQTKRAKTC